MNKNIGQIDRLEKTIKCLLPNDFKEFYIKHDTDRRNYISTFDDGEQLLSIDGILRCWQTLKDLYDKGTFRDIITTPDNGIRTDWWIPKWVPITDDRCGNSICIDLNPAEGGKIGQIISFIHDSGSRELKAQSFSDFISKIKIDNTEQELGLEDVVIQKEWIQSEHNVKINLIKEFKGLYKLSPENALARYNKVIVEIHNNSNENIEKLLLTIKRIGSKIGEDNYDILPIMTNGIKPNMKARYELMIFDAFNQKFTKIEVSIANQSDWEKRRKSSNWMNKANKFSKKVNIPFIDRIKNHWALRQHVDNLSLSMYKKKN